MTDCIEGVNCDNGGSKKREKLVRELAKASRAIQKKHRELKVGKIDSDMMIDTSFRPIMEPLRQLVTNTQHIKTPPPPPPQPPPMIMTTPVHTSEQSMVMHQSPIAATHESIELPPHPLPPQTQSPPLLVRPLEAEVAKRGVKRGRPLTSTPKNLTPYRRHFANVKRGRILEGLNASHSRNIHDGEDTAEIGETLSQEPNVSIPAEELEQSMREIINNPTQNFEHYSFLSQNLGELSMKYLQEFVRDNKKIMDNVYGVYFSDDKLMIGNSAFDMDNENNIIINHTKYRGTPGLYELIFKRLPDDSIYTDTDMYAYKNILLSTNAHKRGYLAENPVMGNKGFKYRTIIAPLFPSGLLRRGRGHKNARDSSKSMSGINFPNKMTASNNKSEIDYVYWNNPNEIVDRLKLLTASKTAGHTGHDNEIMSILEELREEGLIIN